MVVLEAELSSALAGPSDWLIELAVIHVCEQEQQLSGDEDFDLADMVSRVLDLFANFESVKVCWADRDAAMYDMDEIWRPLLSHEPLFMDPANPYCNLADVNTFDAHDLVAAAKPPSCFDVFKREASHFVQMFAGDEDEEDDEDEYEDAKDY